MYAVQLTMQAAALPFRHCSVLKVQITRRTILLHEADTKKSLYNSTLSIVGVDYGEDPPVPILNTEVKLISADDTWLETARENRYSPTQKQTGLL